MFQIYFGDFIAHLLSMTYKLFIFDVSNVRAKVKFCDDSSQVIFENGLDVHQFLKFGYDYVDSQFAVCGLVEFFENVQQFARSLVTTYFVVKVALKSKFQLPLTIKIYQLFNNFILQDWLTWCTRILIIFLKLGDPLAFEQGFYCGSFGRVSCEHLF